MAPPSVLLAGPRALRLTVLAAVLRSMPDVVMIGHAWDEGSIPACLTPTCPDAVVVDWGEDPMTTYNLTAAVRRRRCGAALIRIGPDPEPCELLSHRALAINGYLSWLDVDPDTLRASIAAALNNQFGPPAVPLPRYLSPRCSA